MRDRSRAKQRKVRGQHTNTPFDEGLADVVRETTRLWRKHHSVNRLDAIDAERPCSLKTLLHASLMASTIAALLAHTHNLQTRPPQAGAPRRRRRSTPAPGLAAGRVLSVHCPGLRPEGGRGQAALGQDCSVAHAFRQRPQLAPSAIRLGSATRLETPAHYAQRGHWRHASHGNLKAAA